MSINLNPACVLFVEDNPSLLKSIQPYLKKLGYRVLPAIDAPDALRVWEQHAPEIDLVLTDISMPHGISGIDLAKMLRTDRPHLAVILSSGYVEDVSQLEAAIGGQGISFLQKPYHPTCLRDALQETLEHVQALKLVHK